MSDDEIHEDGYTRKRIPEEAWPEHLRKPDAHSDEIRIPSSWSHGYNEIEARLRELFGRETSPLDDRCFDREGNPITFVRMLAMWLDDEYAVVAKTALPDGERVSTVWLGHDHGFGMTEKPMIFETAVFQDGKSTEIIERYSSEAEALDGHAKLVAALSERAPDAPEGAAARSKRDAP